MQPHWQLMVLSSAACDYSVCIQRSTSPTSPNQLQVQKGKNPVHLQHPRCIWNLGYIILWVQGNVSVFWLDRPTAAHVYIWGNSYIMRNTFLVQGQIRTRTAKELGRLNTIVEAICTKGVHCHWARTVASSVPKVAD